MFIKIYLSYPTNYLKSSSTPLVLNITLILNEICKLCNYYYFPPLKIISSNSYFLLLNMHDMYMCKYYFSERIVMETFLPHFKSYSCTLKFKKNYSGNRSMETIIIKLTYQYMHKLQSCIPMLFQNENIRYN